MSHHKVVRSTRPAGLTVTSYIGDGLNNDVYTIDKVANYRHFVELHNRHDVLCHVTCVGKLNGALVVFDTPEGITWRHELDLDDNERTMLPQVRVIPREKQSGTQTIIVEVTCFWPARRMPPANLNVRCHVDVI